MSLKSGKQKGLLRRMSKNLLNMRKLFRSTEKRDEDCFDPDKVTK